MIAFVSPILSAGLSTESDVVKKKIRFLNTMILMSGAVCFVYTLLFGITGVPLLFTSNFLGFCLFGLCYVFTFNKHFTAARIVFPMTSLIVILINSYVLGFEARFWWFILPVFLANFTFWSNQERYYFHAINAILFGAFSFFIMGTHPTPWITIPPDWLLLLGNLTIIAGFGVSGLVSYFNVHFSENLESELSIKNHSLSEAYQELQASEEEIRQNAEELHAINEHLHIAKGELEHAVEEVHSTQDVLVRSEKMALLGRLVASVAHEINSPMGAIHAATASIQKSMEPSLLSIIRIASEMEPNQSLAFYTLIKSIFKERELLTSREERSYKKDLEEGMKKKGLEGHTKWAGDLVKVGIYYIEEEIIPLFGYKKVDECIQLAVFIGKMKLNLSNIELAESKTQKIVFALKNYSFHEKEDENNVVNLRESIMTVITLYTNQIKYNVQLITEFQDKPFIVQGNGDEISQIWTNIIHNALQAMNYQGDLEIKLYESKPGYAMVSITDSGPGIPPEIQEKIFEPFFTTKKKGEGTGLGLDICKKIVAKYKGDIALNSKPGKTTFFIEFETL